MDNDMVADSTGDVGSSINLPAGKQKDKKMEVGGRRVISRS